MSILFTRLRLIYARPLKGEDCGRLAVCSESGAKAVSPHWITAEQCGVWGIKPTKSGITVASFRQLYSQDAAAPLFTDKYNPARGLYFWAASRINVSIKDVAGRYIYYLPIVAWKLEFFVELYRQRSQHFNLIRRPVTEDGPLPTSDDYEAMVAEILGASFLSKSSDLGEDAQVEKEVNEALSVPDKIAGAVSTGSGR